MNLAQQLEAVRRRQEAEALDRGEADVLAQIATQLPQPEFLDDATRADLQPFLNWTSQLNVRYAPAKPHVIAAYVLHEAATGASTADILRRVNAISALHDRHNLADPVSTAAARHALGQAIPSEPPRSWKKAEKAAFVQLPPEIKTAIYRRDHEREIEVRRLQNELAELKKATTAPEPVTEKEDTNMPSKTNAYNKDDPAWTKAIVRKTDPGTNVEPGKQIYKKVDANSEANNGFSAPLSSED